ncbi:MAG TPA: DUF4349 domain-containing protein [Bacilli bacterium]|nr:DUF4349 domain-containing protein [Bacilli bacterium]
MRTLLLPLALIASMAGLPACGGSAMSAEYSGGYSAGAAPAPMPPMDPTAATEVDGVDAGALFKSADEMQLERSLGGRTDEERGDLAKAPPPAPPPPKQAPGQDKPAAQGAGAGAGAQGQQGQQKAGEAVAKRAPLLIYTAQIGMAVFQARESIDKVEAIARELGGFLSKRDDQAITIRVPVAQFDEAMKRLEGVGDMLHRNVAVEDVTAEFVDLEIRVKNARAVRDRLEKLLEKAASVEESVLLEKELGRVAGEIERMEGRLKLLRDRAAFSTITVTFQARPRESIDPTGPRLPVEWLNTLGLSRLLNL